MSNSVIKGNGMKKVLALAAVFMALAAASFAQEISIKNFKLYSEGSVIGISVGNGYGYGFTPENYGKVYLQSTIGVKFDAGSNIQSAVALGYENAWGGLGGDTLQAYLNTIRVVEANLTFNKLFNVDGLSAKVGRQYYGDEDSTVMYLGIRHYNAEPQGGASLINSVDALAGYYDYKNIKANAIYGILSDNGVNGNESAMGFDFKYSKIADFFNIQVYMYEVENSALLLVPVKKYGFYGVKPSVETGGFKASLEFAHNYGGDNTFSNTDYNSNLIKLDASYDVKGTSLTPRGTYMVIGGRNGGFPNYGNYTPGWIFGQQIYYGSDFQIVNIGADYKGVKNYIFSLDYYNLAERDGSVKFGNELDGTVKYQYTESTELFLAVSHLFKGDNSGYVTSDIAKVMLGVTYKM